MATGTSVVGSWDTYVDWGCSGTVIHANVFTFKADGTWTYAFGGGRWSQVEGMVSLNFSNSAGLVYAANVTHDALLGMMAYLSAPPNPGSGCFYALRQAAGAKAAPAKAAQGVDHAVGPHK